MVFNRTAQCTPVSQNRDDQGRYEEKVPLDAIRAFFEGSEPRTAAEIADELDISNRAVLNKLDELHERGEIKRKKVGGRAVVWYRELNPRTAAEALADVTGRPVEEFLVTEDEYPMSAPDELEWGIPEDA